MNEILFFSEKLQDISKELGVATSTGFLEETQAQLEALSKTDVLTIDVYIPDSASSQIKKMVQGWEKENTNSGILVNILGFGKMLSKSISDAIPAMAVFFFDESMSDNAAIATWVPVWQEQYKIALILNCLPTQEPAQQFAQLLGYTIKSKIVAIGDADNKPLEQLIIDTFPAQLLPVIKTLSRLNRVKPVISILQQIFQTENKIIQTRKLIGTQNQLITRKDEQSLNTMELTNTIRQAVQKFSSDIDKNFRTKYDELNKPVTGNFSKVTQYLSEQLTDFQREHVAEKDEKVEIRLPEEYQTMFLQQMKSSLTLEMEKDAEFLTISISELQNRINNLLAAKGIGKISVPKDIVDFPEISRSLTPYCLFNRQYKGELIKKGIMEYFTALRDYTGVIMVATGLLAPLTIIANLSESGWLKHFANAIKLAMAGIAIFLIIYGIFDLRKRIPKKRHEEFLKEIDKAREYLIAEGKRICSEISRDWLSATSNWVKEISAAVSSEFEKKIKDAQLTRTNEVNQDKMQQQRRQQSLDAQQKNIANAERIKDAVATRYREMYAEAEKKLIL